MSRFGDYAVVYDITSDKERARVDKVLKGFGFRVQKSVFECRLTKREKQELIEKLSKLNIKTGFIKVYRLEWTTKSIVIGEVKKKSIDNGYAFII
ncbi:MAG: CRISPR-associated endonuclease Cas2 [candidate division WOR-3 bacterium]|nr:CRISPR-associated endonuclease Cas2 [candidate division WOR-3 bacterium]